MPDFRPRYRIFIDEVGTKPGSWPPTVINERFLSLTGIIMECVYTRRVFEPDFFQMRTNHFGENCPPLHRREITHRKGTFECLNDLGKRRAWGDDFLSFTRRHPFCVICVTLDRVAWRERHGDSFDPYHICMFNILERYFYFLKDCDCIGDVYAEARNPSEDQKLREAYKSFWRHGPYDIPSEAIQKRFCSRKIHLKDKKRDIPALQYVDLIASAMKRSLLFDQGVLPIDDFSKFQRKLLRYLWAHKTYRSDKGQRPGFGLKWRP